jgi:hypothetical protein
MAAHLLFGARPRCRWVRGGWWWRRNARDSVRGGEVRVRARGAWQLARSDEWHGLSGRVLLLRVRLGLGTYVGALFCWATGL